VRAVLSSAALLAAMRALSVPPNVENNINRITVLIIKKKLK
jgi:hypothetical protein